MKIVQLPSWYLPEGGQFCLHQSLALQDAGIEVHILANVVLPWRKYKLSLLKYPFNAFFTKENNIPIYRYYSWKFPFVDEPNIKKWAHKTVRLFDAYQKEHGLPDIIHAHSSMWAGYAASLIKEKYGVPYVITEHRGIFGLATEYAKNKFKQAYNPYLEKAFSNANYIIPVSSQQITKIKLYGADNAKIRTIPNILDCSFFHPIPRVRKKNEPFVFISVNGFNPYKGYEFLLPAFDIACQQEPNIRLRIVGEDFHKKAFQKLLKTCKNSHKISFAGEIDREGVRKELWAADGYVIASRTEAQSVSTVEALSTGLPAVGTSVTPKEILTDDCGYIVPVENPKALAEAMVNLVRNRSNFDGSTISEHIKKIVSKEVITKQLIAVYEEILTAH
ncbi:MAG: glycosyltransferase [Paludibacteraceae bacterium]|nr:glycosyltransferase [Paludibacteraceae bacterium]MBN2787347.1 glycosyltransferase [Paludibacteraceae bacterium]